MIPTSNIGQQRRSPWRRSRVAMVSILPLLAACDGDTLTRGSEPLEGAPELPGASDSPVYGVVSRITLPEGSSTVLALIDSMEPQRVDTSAALEIPGIAAAHGSPEVPGAVFVASAEAPELTRYALDPAGRLVAEGSFSLAAFGLSRAPRSVAFVSADKAYAISVETHQLFVWNPTDMTLVQTLELDSLERPGYAPAWVFGAAVEDGKLLVPITWVRTDDGDPGALPQSALVSVDVETDAIEVREESRCGGFRAIYASGQDGVLFSSSAGAPATWHHLYGERGGSPPCLVRLNAGEASIDGSFLLRPADFSPHPVAVDFSPGGPDHLVFQALDDSLVPTDATAEELWNAAAWRFYSVPASLLEGAESPDGTAGALPLDLPPSALNALRFEVEERNFVPQISADYSETTLVDITDPVNPLDGPSITGSVGNFFRLR